MNAHRLTLCWGVFAMAAGLVSCGADVAGPDLWTGSEIDATVNGTKRSFTSEEPMMIRDPDFEASARNYLHIDNRLRLGLPSLRTGSYFGDNVSFDWTLKVGYEYVHYDPWICNHDNPPMTITVDGRDYGVVWGTFSGQACRFSIDPGPEQLSIEGTWVASTEEDEWQ